MDPAQLAQLVTAITALIAAIGTLITVLKTHEKVENIDTNTNGAVADLYKRIDALTARPSGGHRSTDTPPPPVQEPATSTAGVPHP